MREFINRHLLPQVEGNLDKHTSDGESGEGGRSAQRDDQPAQEAARPTLDLCFSHVPSFVDLRHREKSGETFLTYDVPELGLVELHLELRGPGIWYASLVECETGRIHAKGRLFPR